MTKSASAKALVSPPRNAHPPLERRRLLRARARRARRRAGAAWARSPWSRPSATAAAPPTRSRSTARCSLRSAHNGFLYVNGTPTDCVHMAVTGLLDFEPDVVVSGINNGANMGDDTLYSGTVAAATEGYLLGIPVDRGVARAARSSSTSPPPARVARELVERLGARALRRPGAAQRERARRAVRGAQGHRGHAPGPPPQGAARGRRARTRAARRCTGSGPRARRARPARAPTSTRSSAAPSRSRRCRSTSRMPSRSRWWREWIAKTE